MMRGSIEDERETALREGRTEILDWEDAKKEIEAVIR